jgi:cell division protein FtsZ
MGGGTGTGSAPVVAEIARELGAVVIGIVTLPFSFEMGCRSNNAFQGVRELRPHVHTLITVPNDRLLEVAPKDVSLEVAFRLADDVLRQGIQGITELVTRPGMINVDFAHVRQLMLNGGGALMAIGIGEGEKKAQSAIQQAIHHPLLELESLSQANGVLVHFTGGQDLTLFEVGEAVSTLRDEISPDAEVILGASTDSAIGHRVQVILIVTGIGAHPIPRIKSSGAGPIAEQGSRQFNNLDREDLDLPAFIRKRTAINSNL